MPTPYSPLPDLNDDEARARFGDDPDALRRYRVLRDILLLDVPQREAAEAAGISERTVRNVLRAYRADGLEAITRRGARMRRNASRKTESVEPAIAQALAEEPHAGGDRLWRRAQALLGDGGGALSRRTAYRILARLRAEARQAEADDDQIGEVRAALLLLLEDPPLSLGALPLAQRLMPNIADALARGTTLQQALRAALDRLRPNGDVSTIDRSWWPYLICTGEYEAGQSRADLQEDLALSASTYSRAKRQGLTQIANVLPRIVATMIEAPTAIASQRLPRTPDFVGRREEQSYYAWRLQTEGVAWIWGLPGSGKTALAAEIAAEGRRYGQTILWHACRAGVDATPGGIADGLLKTLRGGSQRSEQPAGESLIETLREQLAGRASVIVLDDVQNVAQAEGTPLFGLLLSLAQRGAVRLLLVSRERPPSGEWPALPGLNAREAALLWAGLPALPPEQWRALHEATAGLPQPLRQVAAAQRRAGELARPDFWREEIAAWARDAIWKRLSEDDQRLLTVAHALEGRPWAQRAPLLLRALEIAPDALAEMQAQGFVSLDGPRIALHPALRSAASAALREDTRLRSLLDALTATIAEAAERDEAATPPLEDELETPASETPPAGLELLARLQDVLASSAAYLQKHPRDRAARRLANELSFLRSALPDPASMHAAPAQPAAVSSQ